MIASTEAARAALRHATRKAVGTELQPPQAMTLPEWAERYVQLPKSSNPIAGGFRVSRIEVARGPMHAVTEPGVHIITLMVATQLLKTTLLLTTAMRFAHLDPCPMLVVYPKDDAVDSFSKERLAPLIAETPVLRERFGIKTRRADSTVKYKAFPGGFIAIATAGSEMDLSARPIRITFCDEIDKYEPLRGGDPVALAEDRTSRYRWNRLNMRASSPQWEETSRIWKSYQESDQRRPFVECPHCGHWQDLDFFRHVHWEHVGGHHRPGTAAVFCEKCGAAWTEADRLTALGEGRIQWRQCRPFVCCGEGQDPRATRKWEWCAEHQVGYALCRRCGKRGVANEHAGFTCSKLYDPDKPVVQLAAEWIEAIKDHATKQTFINTQLGLPFKAEVSKAITGDVLLSRRENWPMLSERRPLVPAAACVITGGVDVQPGGSASEGRLVLELVGWGVGEESWGLAYETFTGDPALPAVWRALDGYLQDLWQREDGYLMPIRATCIDSGGHNTEEVYKFCRARIGRNVWAIKGASDRGGQWSPVWPAIRRAKNDRYRAGYRPIIIGVNAAKEAVRQRLLIDEPGPGYCHFPVGRPAAYFEQLTAENLVIERRAGMAVRKWEPKKDVANEGLDARVYAYAALCGLYVVRRFDMAKAARMIADAPPKETAAAVIAAQQIAAQQNRAVPAPVQAAIAAPQPVVSAPAPVRRAPAAPAPRQRTIRRSLWRTR